MAHAAARTANHGARGDDGFTLGNLMIAVVVFGIVMGLGVSIFLRARDSSSDAAARTRARQALLTQRMYFADRGLWGQAAEIQPLEPSVDVVDLNLDGPQVLGKVYVKVDGDVATLVSRSATGTCYWARASSTGTTFATSPCSENPTDADFGPSW